MKFRIVRSKFLDGLKKVQSVVTNKSTMKILQNVLLKCKDNQLFLTATDMDISIRSMVQCETIAEGGTTLPAKLLFNTVSSAAEGPIEVEVNAADVAVVNAGSATFNLAGMSMKDYPVLPEDLDSFEYVLPQMTLREMLRKTAYAATQDDTHKNLRGVLVSFKDGKVTMVATDGRRLALIEHEIDVPAEEERDIILPSKVVADLQRSLSGDGDARITIQQSQVAFNLGDTWIYSKLLDGVYPNYRQVIPTETAEHIVIDRQLLLSALERASVMMQDETNSTKLTFDSNQLTVTATTRDGSSARDIVPIKYDGQRIEIVFNPGYVIEPLKAIDEDEVTIELNSGTQPALLKCSIPFLYVMMPLRVN